MIQEQMDMAYCDKQRYIKTLDRFSLVNRLLTRSKTLHLMKIIPDMEKDKKHIYLDAGSGGGDVGDWFATTCKRLGLDVQIYCIDNDKRAINYSSSKYQNRTNIHFIHSELSETLLNEIRPDYIYAGHLAHHLDDKKLKEVLALLIKAGRKKIIINDIYRNKISYLLYMLFSWPFSLGNFIYKDGLISIKKGFKPGDLLELANAEESKISFDEYSLFPGRVVLLIDKK
jgi:2-polyprenyl-3-methyl-5-hydroxy-6-metoxy-1,4-benzoquinol methylase